MKNMNNKLDSLWTHLEMIFFRFCFYLNIGQGNQGHNSRYRVGHE